jgi:hypothetical protein
MPADVLVSEGCSRLLHGTKSIMHVWVTVLTQIQEQCSASLETDENLKQLKRDKVERNRAMLPACNQA